MDVGALMSGLLTGLREGVEAALIVAIILAYLSRTGHRRSMGRIWLGVGLALVVSVAVGVILWASIGGLTSPAEQIFEAVAMLVAAAVVTWMLFWMRRTAASIRGELQAAIDRSLTDGRVWGLTLLAFTAVIREGIETSLFLLGQLAAASSSEGGALSVLVGAVIGLLLAVGIGYGFYRGAQVVNLRVFFRWTGVALIFIAAGLVSHAVGELVEVGVITVGTATAFDLTAVLPHEGPGLAAAVGSILRALFGYNANPAWIVVIAWLAYVAVVLTLYLRPLRPTAAQSSSPETRPVST